MLKIGICGLSVVTAAILGIRTGSRIPERLKAYMMSVLSILCFIVAITSIQKYADLLPVALALICGGILGGAANLSERISQLAWSVTGKMKGFKPGGAIKEEDFRKDFASIFSIVCLSGAGIMGSLIAGTTGDFSILMVKALMDFPVAFLYGGRLGACICLLAVPEMALLAALLLLSHPLQMILTPDVSGNLYACGGAVILSSASSMAGIRNFYSPNLMPAMVLVIPFSLILGT